MKQLSISVLAVLALLNPSCTSSKESFMKFYRLKEITYQIQNPQIAQVVEKSKEESLLKKGQKYDQHKLAKERERIEKLVRQKGFNDFNKQSITFLVDTTIAPRQFTIQTVIEGN